MKRKGIIYRENRLKKKCKHGFTRTCILAILLKKPEGDLQLNDITDELEKIGLPTRVQNTIKQLNTLHQQELILKNKYLTKKGNYQKNFNYYSITPDLEHLLMVLLFSDEYKQHLLTPLNDPSMKPIKKLTKNKQLPLYIINQVEKMHTYSKHKHAVIAAQSILTGYAKNPQLAGFSIDTPKIQARSYIRTILRGKERNMDLEKHLIASIKHEMGKSRLPEKDKLLLEDYLYMLT